MKETTVANVDIYIAAFQPKTQELLSQLRETIKKAAPEAEEMISYQMPAYKFHGILAYFAGYKNHIGFYPTGSGIESFKHKLSAFKTSKGTVQFPIEQPLPLELIAEMVKFRVAENMEKAKEKKKKKPGI
jgi:uncharacterized protein YdhG (YjbR/CyaY superfamily)